MPDFTITFPAITNLSNVVITNVIFGFGEECELRVEFDHGAAGNAGAGLGDSVWDRPRAGGSRRRRAPFPPSLSFGFARQ